MHCITDCINTNSARCILMIQAWSQDSAGQCILGNIFRILSYHGMSKMKVRNQTRSSLMTFQVTVAGNSPVGREGHAACILSRFLLISSGINTSSTGSQRRLADTHILDMATPSWECIDDGAWASSSTWRQMLAQYCVFHGNRLYMLKPSK